MKHSSSRRHPAPFVVRRAQAFHQRLHSEAMNRALQDRTTGALQSLAMVPCGTSEEDLGQQLAQAMATDGDQGTRH